MKPLSPTTALAALLALGTVLAVTLALSPRARAAEFSLVCEDANSQPQTVSPLHPCAVALGLWSPVAGSQEALGVATATALTVPAGATFATISVETQSVRFRCDGTAPTATTGTLIPANTLAFILQVTPLTACQFIQTAPTATLDVEYWHQ
jgi:hypothetical protein